LHPDTHTTRKYYEQSAENKTVQDYGSQ